MPVGQLAEAPGQLDLIGRGPDRISQRYPAAAFDSVHEESVASLAEEESLVAEKREIGGGIRPRVDERGRVIELAQTR